MVLGNSLDYLAKQKTGSVDLIVTSPPFGLVRKKDYGNVESGDYIEWFKSFRQRIQESAQIYRLVGCRHRRCVDS